MQWILPGYLMVVNWAAFFACFADKRRAQTGRRRISEKALWTLCILGGAVGFWLGMYLFHHKTKHLNFRFGVPVLMIVWLAGILWFYSR